MGERTCTKCGAKNSRVTDSRPTDRINNLGISVDAIRRRVVCVCGHRWTTYEVREDAFGMIAEGREVPLILDALFRALRRAGYEVTKCKEQEA